MIAFAGQLSYSRYRRSYGFILGSNFDPFVCPHSENQPFRKGLREALSSLLDGGGVRHSTQKRRVKHGGCGILAALKRLSPNPWWGYILGWNKGWYVTQELCRQSAISSYFSRAVRKNGGKVVYCLPVSLALFCVRSAPCSIFGDLSLVIASLLGLFRLVLSLKPGVKEQVGEVHHNPEAIDDDEPENQLRELFGSDVVGRFPNSRFCRWANSLTERERKRFVRNDHGRVPFRPDFRRKAARWQGDRFGGGLLRCEAARV